MNYVVVVDIISTTYTQWWNTWLWPNLGWYYVS